MGIKQYIQLAVITVFLVLGVTVTVLWKHNQRLKVETTRQEANFTALTTEIKNYKVKIGEDSVKVAQIYTQELKVSEVLRSNKELVNTVNALKLDLKRVLTAVETKISVIDTIHTNVIDSIGLKCINYTDKYTEFSGCVKDSVFTGTYSTKLGITAISHIEPKKFLWFKYGEKSRKLDLVVDNPKAIVTVLKYTEVRK